MAEYFPKKQWDFKLKKERYHCNRFSSRYIPFGSLIDQSALRRIKEMDYRPKNLSPKFIKKVLEIEIIPDELEYQRSTD